MTIFLIQHAMIYTIAKFVSVNSQLSLIIVICRASVFNWPVNAHFYEAVVLVW